MNSENHPLFLAAEPWSGRNDGPGPEHRRWHSVIRPATPETTNAAVLIGFGDDEGVARNQGRQGAAAGPAALRNALGSLAVHDELARYDAGTVYTQGEDLEESQAEFSSRVAELSRQNNLVIALGGGHAMSFATHRGLYEAAGEQSPAIINFDAHFDLRGADQPTSGTPFKQIAGLVGQQFSYTVLGIAAASNTAVLFNTADELGVDFYTDEELDAMTPAEVAQLAVDSVANHDRVHLSIDLDVLPASVAPGVSAPAAIGVGLSRIRAAVRAVAATGKLCGVDIAELNPRYDIDGRTAKLAARLIDDIIIAHYG